MSQRDTQLPRGALYVALGQGAFVLSGFALHLVLTRWLTPASFGVFNVAMTVLVWLEITVNNGVPVALQKFLPDDGLSERAVLRAAARCQALVGVGVFVLMFLAAPLLAALLRDPALTGYLRLALVDVLAMSAYAYYRGALNGWRAFRQLALTIGAYSLAKLTAILLLVYLGLGVQGALIGNVVSSLGGLAMGAFWARRRQSQPANNENPFQQVGLPRPSSGGVGAASAGKAQPAGAGTARHVGAGEIMRFVLPAALFTLASNVLLGLDLMGVKALVTDADQVGYYAAAVKLAEAPRLVLLAFSFTLLPSLSHAISAPDPARTRHYLQQIIRLLAFVLLPILALVTATAGPVIDWLFPAEYAAAAPVLKVLIFSYALYTVYITLVTTLLAENRPGRALAIPLALLPLAGLAVWLGVTRIGVLGAAYASLSSVSAAALVVLVYVLRRYRPGLGALSRSLLRLAAASLAVWGLARLWSPSGLALIPAYTLLGALYLGLLLALREIRAGDLALVAAWLPLPGRAKGAGHVTKH